MKLRERIGRAIAGATENKHSEIPLFTQRFASRVPLPKLEQYKLQVQEGLYKNSAVQGCVAALSQTLPEAKVIVTKPTGEYVESHPIERLFARPNPAMSYAAFMRQIAVYLYTGGNAYIHLVRSNLTRAPIEMYPYNHGQMTPIPDPYKWVSGYAYSVDGRPTEIPATDVIHIKWNVDPLNPTVGLSPIELAGAKIQALNEMDETIFSVMKNNGAPGTIMTVKEQVAQEEANRLREMWADTFGGANRGKLGVLGGDINFHRLSQSMQELEAEGLYGQLESAICGIYRVHPVVAMTYAGLLSSTYSNMESAFREFTKLTRVPVWRDWADQITHGLRHELGMFEIQFDTTGVEALKNDNETRTSLLSEFASNVITLNEVREELGRDAVADGDKYSYELQSAQTGFFSAPDNDVKEQAFEPYEIEGSYDGKRWVMTEEKAFGEWKRIDDTVQKFAEQLQPFVESMIDDAVAQAQGKKAVNAGSIDIDLLVRRFMNATGALRKKLLEQIIAMAVSTASGNLTEVMGFVTEIEAEAVKQTTEKMRKAAQNLKKKVADVVAANVGKPASQVAEALQGSIAAIKSSRAKMIAQTTVTATTSTTQEATWAGMNKRQDNPDKKLMKMWITQRDSKVRDSHEKLDRTVVEIGGEFGAGIKAPALAETPEEAINCRCVLATVRAGRLKSNTLIGGN